MPPTHHCETYTKYLAGTYGYPLWTPQLKAKLPDDYQYEGLKIGDVGIVSPLDGSFGVRYPWYRSQLDCFPESLIEGISDVLLAAGCTVAQPDVTSKVRSEFQDRIASLAACLDEMTDMIVGNDFEVLVARPNEKFRGEEMEACGTKGSGLDGASVLCTISAGLAKRILMETGSSRVVALQAKVLLEGPNPSPL